MKLEQIRMDARAEADLSNIAAITPQDILIFGQKSEQGKFIICAVMDGGERAGTAVISAFEEALVVNAYAVQHGHGDTLLRILPILRETAKNLGLKKIRFWSRHEALARRASAHGFKLNYVCEGAV